MPRIIIEVDENYHNQWKLFSIGLRSDMTKEALKAFGKHAYDTNLTLLPGYEPDECHLCSYPMSDHDYTPATATSPGEYSCPTLDEDELPY
jgi:hypothetical protein